MHAKCFIGVECEPDSFRRRCCLNPFLLERSQRTQKEDREDFFNDHPLDSTVFQHLNYIKIQQQPSVAV